MLYLFSTFVRIWIKKYEIVLVNKQNPNLFNVLEIAETSEISLVIKSSYVDLEGNILIVYTDASEIYGFHKVCMSQILPFALYMFTENKTLEV